MKKRVLALLFALIMVFSLVGCKSKTEDAKDDTTTTTEDTTSTSDATATEKPDKVVASGQYDTLVVGTQTFNGVFSPMFSQNAYDVQAYDPVFTSICRLDKDGVLVDYAGHVEATEQAAADGHTQVLYTVSIQPGMVFSDGSPVTIDDVIFQYYVLADPTYDGSSTFSTLDIVGMKEYYYDTPDYSAQIDQITADVAAKYALDVISEEDFKTYLRESKLAGWYEGVDSYDWLGYLQGEGYDTSKLSLDDETTLFEALVTCEYEHYAQYYDPQTWWQTKKESEFITGNLEDGINVPEISGIKKVDDLTCTVLFDSVNINGDRQVAYLPIVPKAYYGASFVKGDLSGVKAKNGAPMGAGPYKFVSYQDNIVTLEANTKYFGETAKIPFIKFQVVAEADKVDALTTDQIDITDPTASKDVIDAVTASGDSYSLVDNPGYGYIAISAANIPDLNVRKGLMHLMNRGPAVEAYYGELADVIQRPMTPTLAEYPKDATEFYGYDTAKALDYFTKAGYTKGADGKLSKDGEQLVVNVGIGGGGTMDHPSAPILTQMANDMAAMGAELVIQDLDFSTLVNMKDSGELDMWVMAWGNMTDCDLTQLFGSNSSDNDVALKSDELDKLMAKTLQTVDFNERCKLVAQELDIIMDNAVYMPIYQRKNMEIYNASTVKLDTLPEETTTYWNYATQIYKLEMQ